ncbi:MAG TPA: glycosyltransferase family 2 protein [Acetobacteraceae bacterium]|nr:glycosyltransferase family 2 protein [Acetobacteraceae bacterium]
MTDGQRHAPYLSVVAPCFNEESCLPEFHRRTEAAARVVAGDDFEIVLVNDGSRDTTWDVMQRLADSDPHVTAINLSRNYGHQLALTAGLQVCRGERILIIDADLQDPPELVGEMMQQMDEGADVVYGRRRQRDGETRFKRWSAQVFYRVLRRMIDVDIPADTGDFRLVTRRVLDELNALPEHFRFIRGLVSWIGFRQVPLDYDRDARFAGETHYPLLKMLRFAVDAVTGFSVLPLRTASCLGVVLGAGSLLMLIYTLGSWILGRTVDGWTSVTTIVLIIGSVQLMTLGVIGEYLGRLYLEVKRRPLFIIERIIGQQAAEISPRSVGHGRGTQG